jgi:NAD(P)-dependent dehydrogenase (short-subunit alcohol dehydrogenase family)
LLLARATCRRLARRGRGAVASLRDNDDDLLLQAADLVRRSGLPGDLP